MSFIQRYLEHTSIYESPTSFWRFSSYAAIGAVLRDNVWRKQGDKFVYPNIYTLLLADSSVQRKGNPVELCEKLVKAVATTKIVSGRTSIQAIFDVLSTAETDKKTGMIRKGGSVIFFAPELSAGIVSDQQSVGILTDLYDFKEDYKEHLRGKGHTEIDKIVLSLFAGSNETMLKGVYNGDAIYGGLLARTLIVKPDEFRKASSLLKKVDTTESFNALIQLLAQIGKLRGEITISEKAIECYDAWYVPFRDGYRTKIDPTGVSGRIHTTILKLAMILAANDLSTTIMEKHIETSISECMGLMPNYKSFIIGSGKGDLAQAGQTFIQALLDKEPSYIQERRELLRNHWQNFDVEALDKLVTTLSEAGMIKIRQSGIDISYELTAMALENMGVVKK